MNSGTWGKILFSIPFIVFGIFHFLGAEQMVGIVPSYIPGGVLWVYATGAIFFLGGLAILSGKYARLMSLVMAVQLLVFVLLVHLPNISDQLTQIMFLKDVALIGGALMVAHMYPKSHSGM